MLLQWRISSPWNETHCLRKIISSRLPFPVFHPHIQMREFLFLATTHICDLPRAVALFYFDAYAGKSKLRLVKGCSSINSNRSLELASHTILTLNSTIKITLITDNNTLKRKTCKTDIYWTSRKWEKRKLWGVFSFFENLDGFVNTAKPTECTFRSI